MLFLLGGLADYIRLTVYGLTGHEWARYLKQPYDDNYVDSSFLDSLKVNAHLQKYEPNPYVTCSPMENGVHESSRPSLGFPKVLGPVARCSLDHFPAFFGSDVS